MLRRCSAAFSRRAAAVFVGFVIMKALPHSDEVSRTREVLGVSFGFRPWGGWPMPYFVNDPKHWHAHTCRLEATAQHEPGKARSAFPRYAANSFRRRSPRACGAPRVRRDGRQPIRGTLLRYGFDGQKNIVHCNLTG